MPLWGVSRRFFANITGKQSMDAVTSRLFRAVHRSVVVILLLSVPLTACAETDGLAHYTWRVNGVSAGDTLNMRGGPGTNYPVLSSLAHDERGLQLITCVPLDGHGGGAMLSDAELAALPPRWCLVQHPDRVQLGWVAQRYIVEDDSLRPTVGGTGNQATDAEMLDIAEELVRGVYELHTMARASQGPDPFDPAYVGLFFSADIVAYLQANQLQVDPLFNTPDFRGTYEEPYRDRQQPIVRGTITILVDFINFGQPQQAVVRLRPDSLHPDHAIRIMRIEHDGWMFP